MQWDSEVVLPKASEARDTVKNDCDLSNVRQGALWSKQSEASLVVGGRKVANVRTGEGCMKADIERNVVRLIKSESVLKDFGLWGGFLLRWFGHRKGDRENWALLGTHSVYPPCTSDWLFGRF